MARIPNSSQLPCSLSRASIILQATLHACLRYNEPERHDRWIGIEFLLSLLVQFEHVSGPLAPPPVEKESLATKAAALFDQDVCCIMGILNSVVYSFPSVFISIRLRACFAACTLPCWTTAAENTCFWWISLWYKATTPETSSLQFLEKLCLISW